MLKACHRRYNISTCISMCCGIQEINIQQVVKNYATVAQLVEQLICNQPVGGSTPSGGSENINS